MRRSATSRRFRYGSLSVVLTVFVIAVVVIVNVIFQTLATRYAWFVDMTSSGTFTLSDDCRDYVADNIIPLIEADNAALSEDQKIRIIFPEFIDRNAAKKVGRRNKVLIRIIKQFKFRH